MVDDGLTSRPGPPTPPRPEPGAQSAIAVHLDGINDALIVRGRAEASRPDAALGAAVAAAMTAKYADYSPTSGDWDDGGLHRLIPSVMLAWRDMPTATRWRFPRTHGDVHSPT